mmetsp:Transcript_20702/g.58189  ORF Transcript_20702/g.58189 Transcript_20702/m.58189 type:complete len:228 (-) Transcript_20702:1263-1946(-)
MASACRTRASAATRRPVRSFVARALARVFSDIVARSRMCCSSFASVWLMSEGSAPIVTGTRRFISGPFCRTKAVQARVMLSASEPAASTRSQASSSSSPLSGAAGGAASLEVASLGVSEAAPTASSPPCPAAATSPAPAPAAAPSPGPSAASRGAAAAARRWDWASAFSTRLRNSSTRALAASSSSWRRFSSAARFSSTRRRRAVIISMHFAAASSALSDSMRSRWN